MQSYTPYTVVNNVLHTAGCAPHDFRFDQRNNIVFWGPQPYFECRFSAPNNLTANC